MKLQPGIFALCLIAASAGCGKKKKKTDQTSPVLNASTLSLSALPDMSSMIKKNSASLDLAVTGTAPLVTEITAKNYDTIMFGGTIAAVTAASSTTAEQADSIRRGEAVCRNIASSASAFSQLGGGSLCYFSKLAKLTATTVTINKATDDVTQTDYAKLFLQSAKSRLVKLNMNVPATDKLAARTVTAYIKVQGKDDYAQGYGIDFYSCSSNTAQNPETIRIDATAGTFTDVSLNSYKSDIYASKSKRSITAYLKSDSDSFAWDLTQPREIDNEYWSDGDAATSVSKQKIIADASNFLTQMIMSSDNFKSLSMTSTGKLWTKTAFEGDSAKSLRLNEMALSMNNETILGGKTYTDSPHGAVEWVTSTYADTTTSDLYTQGKNFDFTSDTIYSTTPTAPTIDVTSFDCTGTPDIEVTFDMSTTEAQAVLTSCSSATANAALGVVAQLCSSTELTAAKKKVWQH